MLPRARWCPKPLAEHQPAAWAWPRSIRCLGSPASTSLKLRAQLCLVQRGVGRGDPTRKQSPVNQRRARGHFARCCSAEGMGGTEQSSRLCSGGGRPGWRWVGLQKALRALSPGPAAVLHPRGHPGAASSHHVASSPSPSLAERFSAGTFQQRGFSHEVFSNEGAKSVLNTTSLIF